MGSFIFDKFLQPEYDEWMIGLTSLKLNFCVG